MNVQLIPPAIPTPASTLILLRDATGGPEVLMLKRHGLSDVLGNAYVFPGGKLDPADRRIDPATFLDESPALLKQRLAEPLCDEGTAAALFVAAIREAFEESGILMVEGTTERVCTEVAARLHDGLSFGDALAALNLKLCVSHLLPWSRWITPVSSMQAKRFDTRFFVARAPLNARAQHDGHETTETRWMQPHQALQHYWDGEISFAPPQIMTLIGLSGNDDVDGILADARTRPPSFVEPFVIEHPEGRRLCYPGDPAHAGAVRVMRGPLRLTLRNGRYEAGGGFEAYFD